MKRKGLRTSFTLCSNKLKEELSRDMMDLKIIPVLRNQLRDKFYRWRRAKTKFQAIAETDLKFCGTALQRDCVESRKLKLPEIELKNFSGEAKIHSDASLPAEDKFQYLVQSLVPGSKAARVVESLPMTAANYPKAMEL
ncbi:DUF1758 domain-containing protein [Caerostris extrusa]|uniref:DUF1758 domain-containing protein n=1 Tax=Caerostris extrusa TaxID=172846 RepID=A0AAV4V383_CAEEX|nr:DUF1758 domain-containing protein [Caerostris extrusa]